MVLRHLVILVFLLLEVAGQQQDGWARVGVHYKGPGTIHVYWLQDGQKAEKAVTVEASGNRFGTMVGRVGRSFVVEDASSGSRGAFRSVVRGSGSLLCRVGADGAVACDSTVQRVESDEDLPRVMHAALFGESTHTGDRDVRFVNCRVPCEFACATSPSAAASALQAVLVPRLSLLQPVDIGRADLHPKGTERYAANLTEMLRRAHIFGSGSSGEAGDDASDCAAAAAAAVVGGGGVRFAVPTRCLAAPLRLLGWSCGENCRYECMVENRAVRRAARSVTVHYYGKWPFTRVFGAQELLSSLFSLLNGLPHFRFLVTGAPWRHPCRGQRDTPLWILYAAVHVNAWLQSALFHARETKLFETLDYHSATLSLVMALAAGLAMNLPARWPMARALGLALLPVLTMWGAHVGYLTFYTFDYGYNMVFAVAVGGGAMLVWIVWFVRHLDEVRPFASRVPVAILGPALALPLELLDFPPLWDVLDAHALWHLCTVPVQFLIYDCLEAKMRHGAAAAAAGASDGSGGDALKAKGE